MANCSYSPNGQIARDAQFISAVRSKRFVGCDARFNNVESNLLTVNDTLRADELVDQFNVKFYGAVGDGVTDDTAAVMSAFSTILALPDGGCLFFPSGTYLIDVNSADFAPQLLNNIRLHGCGNSSILRYTQVDDGNSIYLWATGSNVLIENLYIDWVYTGLITNFHQVFRCGDGQYVTLQNCTFNFNTPVISGSVNRNISIWNITGDSSDYIIKNNTFLQSHWGVLKSNTSTAVNRRWYFENNTFYQPTLVTLTFNTIAGEWTDTQIIGNRFIDMQSYYLTTGSNFLHVGGVAGSTTTRNFVFTNNVVDGHGSGFHFEDASQNITVSNNVFRVSDIGIDFLDNGVDTNERFTVCDNVIEKAYPALEPNPAGIVIVSNGGVEAAADFVISGNVVVGDFGTGIKASGNMDKIIVCNNNIKGSTGSGLLAVSCTENIFDNLISSTPLGVFTNNGGMIGKNFFTAVPLRYQLLFNGIAENGFKLQDTVTLAAGVNDLIITTATTKQRISGRITLQFAGYRIVTHAIDFDGTLLTSTLEVQSGSGAIVFVAYAIVGNNLVAQVNNTGAVVDPFVYNVSFEGYYHFNA